MGAGAVAVLVGQAIITVKDEIAAGTGAVFVDSATHLVAHVPHEGVTAGGFGFCALHAGSMRADLAG